MNCLTKLKRYLRRLSRVALGLPITIGGIQGSLRVEARDAAGNITGVVCKDDLCTKQFAQLIMANILNTGPGSSAMTDTSNATHTVTANSAATVPTIVTGTNSTPAAFADHALGTATADTQTAVTTVTFSSNTFHVDGIVTAGADRAYTEVGIVVTVGSNVYLITHDVFSTLNVSSGGTLAVTYTFTFT